MKENDMEAHRVESIRIGLVEDGIVIIFAPEGHIMTSVKMCPASAVSLYLGLESTVKKICELADMNLGDLIKHYQQVHGLQIRIPE